MISVTILGDNPCLKKEVFLSATDVPVSMEQAEKKIRLPSGINNDLQEYSVSICNTTALHDMQEAQLTFVNTSNAVVLVMNGAGMKPPFISFRYYMKVIRENQLATPMGDNCDVPVVLMVMNLEKPYEHRTELNCLCIDYGLIAKAMFDQGQLDSLKVKKSFDAAFEHGRTHLTTTMMTTLMPMRVKFPVRCKSIRGVSQLVEKHVSQPALTSSADFREMQHQIYSYRVPSPDFSLTCDSPSSDSCPSPGDVRSVTATPSPSPRTSEKSHSPRKRLSAKRAQKSVSTSDMSGIDGNGCTLQ